MSGMESKLIKAPIVEAVIDIDCDMPPDFCLALLEKPSCKCFQDRYPNLRFQYIHETKVETKSDETSQLSRRHGIQSFQFLQTDGKQLVQVRAQGFSFNRLAPYSSLDDYLPEIERTWRLFIGIASPVRTRVVHLRYINRILLPMVASQINLDDYLKFGPHMPDEEKMALSGFLNQYAAVESDTGNKVTVFLTTQPLENDKLPIIFDVSVASKGFAEPEDWTSILAKIHSLRNLKNRIFQNTLTEQCINLFKQ